MARKKIFLKTSKETKQESEQSDKIQNLKWSDKKREITMIHVLSIPIEKDIPIARTDGWEKQRAGKFKKNNGEEMLETRYKTAAKMKNGLWQREQSWGRARELERLPSECKDKNDKKEKQEVPELQHSFQQHHRLPRETLTSEGRGRILLEHPGSPSVQPQQGMHFSSAPHELLSQACTQ